jgi:hypothetical protein
VFTCSDKRNQASMWEGEGGVEKIHRMATRRHLTTSRNTTGMDLITRLQCTAQKQGRPTWFWFTSDRISWPGWVMVYTSAFPGAWPGRHNPGNRRDSHPCDTPYVMQLLGLHRKWIEMFGDVYWR